MVQWGEEKVEKGGRSRRARSRQAPPPPCPHRGREGVKRRETEIGGGENFPEGGRYIYSGHLWGRLVIQPPLQMDIVGAAGNTSLPYKSMHL